MSVVKVLGGERGGIATFGVVLVSLEFFDVEPAPHLLGKFFCDSDYNTAF